VTLDIPTLDAALERTPDWVQRAISRREARAISDEIGALGASRAIEIGVASGFSSVVIYAALAQNTSDPELYAFDRAESLYYDKSRKTGDAFYEMLGPQPGYRLDPTRTTASITGLPSNIDFAFIDAEHRHPWAALDVLSVCRFLSSDATIALHDLDMIFKNDWKYLNGPRDLYRVWQGDKYKPQECENLGFIRRGEDRMIVESVRACLLVDGDRRIAAKTARKFCRIAEYYGDEAARALRPVIWRHVEERQIARRPFHELVLDRVARLRGRDA
jgi:hypothetical protein